MRIKWVFHKASTKLDLTFFNRRLIGVIDKSGWGWPTRMM